MPETKGRLIHALSRNLAEKCGLESGNSEVQVMESTKASWRFRGQTSGKIALNYKIEV